MRMKTAGKWRFKVQQKTIWFCLFALILRHIYSYLLSLSFLYWIINLLLLLQNFFSLHSVKHLCHALPVQYNVVFIVSVLLICLHLQARADQDEESQSGDSTWRRPSCFNEITMRGWTRHWDELLCTCVGVFRLSVWAVLYVERNRAEDVGRSIFSFGSLFLLFALLLLMLFTWITSFLKCTSLWSTMPESLAATEWFPQWFMSGVNLQCQFTKFCPDVCCEEERWSTPVACRINVASLNLTKVCLCVFLWSGYLEPRFH